MLLYYSINKAGSTSICISPTLNQSRKIYKEILKGIQNLPVYQSSNSTILEINLTNGSCIKFKSGEQRDSLRGESVNGVLIRDEAVFIPDDVIFTTLPFVDVAQAPILLTSTPKFRNGVFYDFFQNGLIYKVVIDGKTIAGCIGELIGEDFYLHKIAHDNKFSRYNLGQIALLKLIEQLINFRVKRFHFLWSKGVDYKIRFGGYHMLYGHTHSTQHTHFLITRNCALRKLWKQSLLF